MEFSLGPHIEPYIAMAQSDHAMEFNWSAVTFMARKTEADICKTPGLFVVNKDTFYFLLSMTIGLREYSDKLSTNWKRILESSKNYSSKFFPDYSVTQQLFEFFADPQPSKLCEVQNVWCKLHLINFDCTEIDRTITELFGGISALWNVSDTYGWNEVHFNRKSYYPFNIRTSINEIIKEAFDSPDLCGCFIDWERLGVIAESFFKEGYFKDRVLTGGIDFSKKEFLEKESCMVCNWKIRGEYKKIAPFDFPEYHHIKGAIRCERELLALTDGDPIAFIMAREDKKSDLWKYCESQVEVISQFCDNPTSEALYNIQKALLIINYAGVYCPELIDRFKRVLKKCVARETDPNVNWDPRQSDYGREFSLDDVAKIKTSHVSNKCFHIYICN